MRYKCGQVIWDKNYQKYMLIIGYDENKGTYLVDDHKVMQMSEKDIDMFKSLNYNKENLKKTNDDQKIVFNLLKREG